MNANDILKSAEKYFAEVCRIRQQLHRIPGTGFDISDTVEYVAECLMQMGIKPKKCGKAGLTATVGGKREGKVFMLRADMDGLPIKELSDVSFRSQNGNMHACGHDMHTAMLLGAARLLKDCEDEICGTVKLMFQPAEEIFEGSSDMIVGGLLDNPKPSAAMMIHVMAAMPFEPGTVIISSPGVSAPAADCFEIKVKGKGCHGSMPNTGIDPLTAAAHILIALQEINARELALDDRVALTIGSFNGGSAANAIPDSAILCGSLRTFDENLREQLKKRITEIATLTASAFRTRSEIRFTSGCPSLLNDTEISSSAEKYVKELLGESSVFTTTQLAAMSGGSSKSAGSEDFAHVSRKVPSVMLALAAGNPESGYSYPQHHPKVKFDESALKTGSAVFAYTALRWLEDNS